MRKLIKPIGRMYSEGAAYRNFVQKDYQRKLALHHAAVEEEIANERKPLQPHRISMPLVLILTLLSLILLIFFTRAAISVIAFSILLLLASFSTIYKRKLGIPLGGIELVTFGTVLTAVAFGPIIGLLFGTVTSLASEIMSQNIGPLTWIYTLTMAVVGLLAGFFSQSNVVFLGMAATIVTVLINQVVYLFIGDEEVKSFTLFYIFTNLAFNFIVFTTLAPRVVTLLAY